MSSQNDGPFGNDNWANFQYRMVINDEHYRRYPDQRPGPIFNFFILAILAAAAGAFIFGCYVIKEQSRQQAEYETWLKTFEQRGEQAGLTQRRKDQSSGDWSIEQYRIEYEGRFAERRPPGYPVTAKDESTLKDSQQAYEEGFDRGYHDRERGTPSLSANQIVQQERQQELEQQRRAQELRRLEAEDAKFLRSLGIEQPPK